MSISDDLYQVAAELLQAMVDYELDVNDEYTNPTRKHREMMERARAVIARAKPMMAKRRVFHLEGAFVPYVRMTQRSKFADPRAQAYRVSQQDFAVQIWRQMQENGWHQIPKGRPLAVGIKIETSGALHRCDLDNQMKAILDVGNALIYGDDRWIDRVTHIERVRTGRDLVTLEISEIEGGHD